jgi:hypothetical protein
MKTKSIRARVEDAKKLQQTCWELSADVQREITVSELINGLMECLESAKERIKRDDEQISD